MTPFDTIAQFYDACMGAYTKKAIAPVVRKLLRTHHPKAETLLELGCGAGSMLEVLRDDYRVEGLDITSEMLALAGQKLPGVPLTKQSMTDFTLDHSFDIILSASDSVNHLLTFREWKRTFQRAHRHLNINGVFLFDIVTERQYDLNEARPVSERFGKNRENTWTIDITRVTKTNVILHFRIFERQTGAVYLLHEEDVHEATFPLPKVRQALRTIFSSVRVIGDGTCASHATCRRVFFLCRK